MGLLIKHLEVPGGVLWLNWSFGTVYTGTSLLQTPTKSDLIRPLQVVVLFLVRVSSQWRGGWAVFTIIAIIYALNTSRGVLPATLYR